MQPKVYTKLLKMPYCCFNTDSVYRNTRIMYYSQKGNTSKKMS